MFYKQILLFFLFTALSFKAFSAVFVVTSNADSGLGTLRDALTQASANGSATTDYINFNLPDTSGAGRTIIISSDLPNLSSNLVIDASTQPGAKFGMSDAKIKLIARITDGNYNITLTTCFNINSAQSIEIYGFLFDCINATSNSGYSVHSIGSLHATDLTVGAPGKGNILKTAAGIALYYQNDQTDSTYNRNVKISSNIFGISENNVSLADTTGTNIYATRVVNLTLGGMTPAEGNKFSNQVVVEEDNNSSYNIHTGNLLVANNSFGADLTGTKNFTNNRLGSVLIIDCYYLSSAQISNNLFIGYTDMGLDVNCFFKLTGNKFGTDITGTQVLGTTGFQLVLGYCGGGGIIGGITPGDGNIFSGAYSNSPPNNGGGIVLNIGSPSVEVVGNIFRCNNSTYPYQLSLTGFTKYFVNIFNRTANSISGTATANSRVDLYYSLTCDHCEPEKQFTSVNADVNGNWNYTGSLLNNNIIASSTYKGTTSEFTALRFTNQPTDVMIKMACGAKNGSITGLTANDSVKYSWYDTNGNVVAATNNLLNAPPGKYYLIVNDGYCSISSNQYEIKDASNQIDTTNEKVMSASCNQQDGSITGIQADPTSSFTWTNNAGGIIGYSQDLIDVPEGKYTLTVTTADGSCSQTLGPINVKNVSGPNIDQSQVAIQSTNCGQSTGSITNLVVTGTGTLSYIWWNNQQQTVSTTQGLTGQPAGTYKLEVTDDSQCGPVYTTDITIPQTNGITVDESKAQIKVASCSNNNGSITGIVATGATQYQWTDANNKIVGTIADLLNVGPGNYILTASNNFGCSSKSKSYTVGLQPPTKFPVYPSDIIPACSGKDNGSVSVTVDSLVETERWVNNAGQTITTGVGISNVAAGVYSLYLTDQNGCENLYNSYTVSTIPQLQIVPGSEQVKNDQCALKAGSITSVQVAGGTPPYTYSWLDANNNTISSAINLIGVGEGIYTLNVNDASGCGLASAAYTVQNQDNIIAAPVAGNVQLCSPGDALLRVNNPSAAYSYRLYDSETGATPVDEAANGSFKITVKTNTAFYVSQLSGNCESARTTVQVSVGITPVDIANAFTPNGDGINDYWKIKGIENYPAAIIQVFNRYGLKVFESKGYTTPFDGTFNGKQLPVGVYYYIINLSTNCSLLSGSLTIIR